MCKSGPNPLTTEEIAVLEDLTTILQRFEEATRDISGDKYKKISLVIPVITGLYSKLLECPDLKTEIGKEVLTKFIDSVRVRLFPFESRSVIQLSAILDPRFETLPFRTNEQMGLAKKLLQNAIAGELNAERAEREKTSEAREIPEPSECIPGPSTSKGGHLFEFINVRRRNFQQTFSISTTNGAIVIMKNYLEAEPVDLKEKYIFTYWKNYPNKTLRNLAIKTLIVQGSSVPSERAFSTAGNVITDNRSRMKPDKYRKIIFLKINSWLY